MGTRFSYSQRAREKQLARVAMKQMCGAPSAWAAHKGRSCVSTCYYCRKQKLHLFSRFWRILKMPASMRRGDRTDKGNKKHQATMTERLFRNPMQFFRAKV